MAAACATLDEFLVLVSEFGSYGPASSATLTVASQPSPGDTITITDDSVVPAVVGTLTAVAGAPATDEFEIGADETETATNIAAALAATGNATAALVTATSSATVVTVVSVKTGPHSRHTVVSSTASLLWSDATLTGGAVLVQDALDCACAMINVECWGAKASCGHVYLAAHVLAKLSSTGSGGTGAVVSETIDKLSVSYAAPSSGGDADLSSTKYGQMYLLMRESIIVTPMVARSPYPRLGGW